MLNSSASLHRLELAHQPLLGAIDLGTNSCRLLIASVNLASLKKTFFRRRPNLTGWRIVDSFAKIVRLGEGLHKSDELSLAAIQRAIEALKVCRKKVDYHGVSLLRAVATEACRRAKNRHILIERAKKELGLDIEIIDGKEEARLALTGCAAILNPNISHAIVFDIGGGSTEVIWLKLLQNHRARPGYPVPFEVIDSISLPYGVVTISESYAQFASSPEIHQNIRKSVSQELKSFAEHHKIRHHIINQETQLIGSSGTVTTLSAIQVGLKHYERHMIDGLFIQTSRLHSISQRILNMSALERAQHPCIGVGRADLVVVGSAILEGIFDALPISELRVADRGVREGILSELLTQLP